MLKAKKTVEGLIESSDTYLSQGNVPEARASLEDAKSTCEKHNLGSGVMSKINRRIGDINRAQGVANYKERRKSFSGASRRNSSVASARRESFIGVSVEKGNPLIDTVPRDMSKPSTSRSPAYDGLVDEERAASAKKSVLDASVRGKSFSAVPCGKQKSILFIILDIFKQACDKLNGNVVLGTKASSTLKELIKKLQDKPPIIQLETYTAENACSIIY